MTAEGRVQIRVGWGGVALCVPMCVPPFIIVLPELAEMTFLVSVCFLVVGYRLRRRGRRHDAHHAATVAQSSHQAAQHLSHQLTARCFPPPVALADPILPAGEPALLVIRCLVRRWRRYVIPLRPRVPWYLARDALGVAAAGIDEMVAAREARALAQPAWRDPCHSQIVLTPHRLLWRDRSGWVALPLAEVISCLDNTHRLEVEALGQEPARFDGPQVDELAVYLQWLLHTARSQ